MIDKKSTRLPVSLESVTGPLYLRRVSVLLVFESPADLDRICHQLETREELMVDFSISGEDALHLMHYVGFDVIVTEYTADGVDRISFLKVLRDASITTPLIYYLRSPDLISVAEANRYGPVYFVRRPTEGPHPEPDNLYVTIMQAVSENP